MGRMWGGGVWGKVRSAVPRLEGDGSGRQKPDEPSQQQSREEGERGTRDLL